jgi:hypothetical protein
MDGCARQFFFLCSFFWKDSGMETADIRFLQLLLSAEGISICQIAEIA